MKPPGWPEKMQGEQRMFVDKVIREGVCILSLNHPEVHNALDPDAMADLRETFRWAQQSDEFRVVLLRGEGKSFCSGLNTRTLGQRKPGVTHYPFVKLATQAIRTLLDMGKPVIAAVKGGMMGAGAELALVADFRISSTDLKFALPEVNLGLSTDQGGSALAASLIGPARTKYLLMTGNVINAKTAYEWGLVDFLVEPEELDAKAFEMAAGIAAKPSHRAVLACKELVDELWQDSMRAAMRRELITQVALLHSEEFEEVKQMLAAKRAAAGK
jgi:enoyl-CoA hydratase